MKDGDNVTHDFSVIKMHDVAQESKQQALMRNYKRYWIQ